MKKIFLSAFAVFMVCVIGFAASLIIFGSSRNVHYTYPVEYGKNTIFGNDYSGDMSWTVLNDFPYVTINSAGVKTIVGRSETDRITVHLENPNKKTVHAEAVYQGDYLTLEFRPTNITFDLSDIKFGITSWLEDIFTGNSDIIVTVGFPETIYDRINVQQGSGTVQINDLYSRQYDFNIGSGKCEFSRPASGDFKSDIFMFSLGSGSAVFSGMESDVFDIRIGSGSFTLDRLSGSGEINMGSGKGEISFCDKPNGEDDKVKQELNMGSGNLTLYYPEDGGVTIDSDFGSGKIEIDAFNYKKTINHSNYEELDDFAIGNGSAELEVKMGSGLVTIKDSKSYTAPEIISGFKVYPSNEPVMSSTQQVTVISAPVLGDVTIVGVVSEDGLTSDSEQPVGVISVTSDEEKSAGDTANTAQTAA